MDVYSPKRMAISQVTWPIPISGWWFQTFFPIIYGIILPIDELHHFSSWAHCTTNQIKTLLPYRSVAMSAMLNYRRVTWPIPIWIWRVYPVTCTPIFFIPWTSPCEGARGSAALLSIQGPLGESQQPGRMGAPKSLVKCDFPSHRVIWKR